VAGTPELAAAVASLNEDKPVYAFSSGLMASAAYWIASQARAIYATPSAQVGSIGVVQAVVDDSGALDRDGIKVEVFSVGKYKAMGAPGTSLTDDQRDLMQPSWHAVDRFQPKPWKAKHSVGGRPNATTSQAWFQTALRP
jgi:ClpP class serine protease